MVIEKGRLVRWIDDKGFGFIKPDNGKQDIFIHISALKGMSRKPIVGDVIHYQISFDANGKARAVNARIEGVSQDLALVPLEQKPKRALASSTQGRSYRNASINVSKPRRRFGLAPILIFIGAAITGIYDKISKEKDSSEPVVETSSVEQTEEVSPVEQTEQFQCQGKTRCSEMTSYEEAIFYLHNCPGTKMDGDGDGEPCERQF
jgi:cold shock CspA family protein